MHNYCMWKSGYRSNNSIEVNPVSFALATIFAIIIFIGFVAYKVLAITAAMGIARLGADVAKKIS